MGSPSLETATQGIATALGQRPGDLRFVAAPNPHPSLLRTLARLSGEACHYAEPYLRALTWEGGTLVAFVLYRGEAASAFGVALEEGGAFNRRLTFPTFPRVLDAHAAVDADFWIAVRHHCRGRRVMSVRLQSFEAMPLAVPPLGMEAWRRERTEYILDLSAAPEDLFQGFASNHRRNIRKAEEAGLTFQVADTWEACRQHAALVGHSMDRRRARGEQVPGPESPEAYHRLVAEGAGRIFRLERNGRVLSSFLMLSTPRCAYYESGGTAEEGMALGSSHALMWRAMLHLRERGVTYFNMGGTGAQDSEGLRRYKAGFGARQVNLAHLEFRTAGPLGRCLRQSAGMCRRAPARLAALWRGTENGGR